jgi:hypothetical protein
MNAQKPLAQRSLPPPFWFAMLVRGYQSSGAIARPVRDCEGQLAVWTADTCVPEGTAAPLDPEPLADRDLVISPLDGGRRLVWVVTDRFASGEAVGPVALAEFDARGVAAHALGVLRAYPLRAELRLEKMGDGEALVAEGEACDDPQDPKTCVRAVRVMPVGKRRFVPRDVTDPAGRCVGRAFFPLRAEGSVGEGARRKVYKLEASVQLGADGITVEEQLTIGAQRQEQGSVDAVASAVSRMRAARAIRLDAGRLIADGPSLLERWRKQAQ